MADQPKLFLSLRKLFQALGINPSEANQTHRFKWKTIFFVTPIILMFITSFAFFLWEAETVDDYGTSFYGSMTQISQTHNVLMIAWQMPTILKMFRKFESLIESRAHYPISKHMYNELIEKIERMCRFLDIFMVKTSFYGVMIPPLINSAVNYYILDLKDESFLMPRPMMLPFNWKTPVGYLVAWIFQAIGFLCTLIASPCSAGLYLGSCWLFELFAKDLASDLPKLNDIRSRRRRNCRELNVGFCRIVQFYSDLKQLMKEFNKICEFVIFVAFFWTLLTIGSSLMAFFALLSEDDSNSSELISPLILASWSVGPVFIYCEFGTMVTDEFEKFCDELYQCKWYSFPNGVQQMMVVFIAETQDPVLIRGYCNIVCIRDSFKKTMHVGFSYFMALQRISA